MTIKELLNDMGEDVVKTAKSILKKKHKNNTGSLYNSIKYNVKGRGLEFIMKDYGMFVNDGRKPGKGIPVNVLEKWMKQRGIDKKYSYVINKKIRERGIKPTYFFTIAVDINIEHYKKQIDEYIDTLLLEINFD